MVKFVPLCTALAATAHFVAAATLPGQCKTNKDCETYGSGYSCISVQTNIAGITLASQCVLGSACGGNIAGKCPTFSSWSSSYQKIQPVCAFTTADNCNNVIANTTEPPATTSSTTQSPSTVNCYGATFSANNESVIVNGIYKCIDSVLYSSNNLGGLRNLTDSQLKACQGNATSGGGLCNGHGTCAPVATLSSTYQCVCNQGYAASDNCLVAVSNVCDNFGSCGSGNSCDPKTGQCVCTGGTKGPQCSQCDASSSAACNGNGLCNANDGTCKCSPGYTGPLCGTKNTTAGGGTGGGSAGGGNMNAANLHAVELVALAVGIVAWML
ncbi:unnamed protein product [Aphanomyces euteiches]|uniref:EGF-like domain-containing protein n=1 Tax=Aphanomyces euteiches TaxID=100861 RepID=A0A6G0XU88_9STRA|nr:hypothetical protein Ae201684_001639 [Aphanomyces euteiches]KAH9075033.1 hypothetical protein Ae201684P_003718 [Aphanomyces euteiches]KAH9132475.1 hypothetical protein AeRB84_021121 [Aphanomyces euteiches]